MASGIDALDWFEDGAYFSVHLSHVAANKIMDEAVLEGLEPERVVSRALARYFTEKELLADGYDGPFFEKKVREDGILGRLGLGEVEKIKFDGYEKGKE